MMHSTFSYYVIYKVKYWLHIQKESRNINNNNNNEFIKKMNSPINILRIKQGKNRGLPSQVTKEFHLF
jgi:hypothetical protein